MNCKQVREECFDLASGANRSADIDAHLRACTACAAELDSLKQTMALMDEWKAPEPSPFFMTRLHARMAEPVPPRTFAEWLREALSPFTATGRRVALGVAMTLLLGVGVALFQSGTSPKHPSNGAANVTVAQAKPGTAVSDLQALDKNADLYANFDLLDDVNP